MPTVALDTALSPAEAERLEALHDQAILDTPPSPDFDALARLAAQACDAPVAGIGLLDRDRLWFKARVGALPAELPASACLAEETAQALGGLLCVPDLSDDSRFQMHPVRTACPEWRFYAGAVIHDEAGHALGVVSVASPEARQLDAGQRQALADVARLAWHAIDAHAQRRTLARQAITDPLTGLANRAHFDQALNVELAHAMRRGEPFTVLVMDLDGFKEINDGFGHAAGVDVLRAVAERIQAQVRTGDVVARFGIDEFGVVMRHGGRDDAQVLARRIVRAVAGPITLSSGDTVGVGISVGMAAYDDDIESVRTLLAQADQALFEAKRQNEKRWKMFMGLR